MATANLPIVPPSLPSGYCPTTWQQLANEIVGKAVVQFTSSSFTVVITSATAPAATDRDKLWFNTNDDRIYRFHDGAWLNEHEEAPSGLARRIYIGTLTQLQTYDGGDTDASGDASGPMWERDTDFNDRIPIGVGSTLATTVGTNYGDSDASITLSDTNIQDHRHFIAANLNVSSQPAPTASNQIAYSAGGTGNENYIFQGTSTGATIGRTSTVGAATGANEAFSILNPVRGVYLVKRTARIYRKAT